MKPLPFDRWGSKDMMRNNPSDVVYTAFSQAFLQGMIRMFQTDREMQSIVMRDVAAREQATKHVSRGRNDRLWGTDYAALDRWGICGMIHFDRVTAT